MDKDSLKQMVESGKTTTEIAAINGLKSSSTVRHWMKKYGIAPNKRGAKKTVQYIQINGVAHKHCKRCDIAKPLTDFHARKQRDGQVMPYCIECSNKQSSANFIQRTTQIKKLLVDHKGGICERCKGTFDIRQYDFHHLEPEHKDFQLSKSMRHSVTQVVNEIQKCVLLCANCHTHTHHLNKQQDGYDNKIKGNTELWNINKERKLAHIGEDCCIKCGYSEYAGALSIVFPDHLKHYRKYNKTHWDDDFKQVLSQASVLCNNCLRLQ